jgi:glycosyltransferase involved in cell wall biosynthesis
VFFAIGTLGPGGAERQMTNVLLGLKSRYGVQPQTVVAYLDNESQSFFEPVLTAAGMPVDALPRSGHPLTALAGCGHPDAPRLAAAIAATLPVALHDVALYTREFLLRNPHVVHLWLDEVNIKAGLGAALAGVPRIVLSTRSLNPSHFPLFQPYMRAGYRVLTRRPHVVFLNNSTTGARDYEEWLGVTRGTCTVISNGFDFSSVSTAEPAQTRAAARRRFGFPETAPVIGGVMRLSVEKRPLLWLDVAARVLRDHPEARFLLVGDGTMRDAVAARAAQPPLADRVMLTGHVPQPYDTIPAMDLLFLSSRHEGLPNVLIEAQALGIAVVTMPAGGAAETIDPGGSGWVVPTDDVDAAAGIISGAIADREMLQRAGERGRAFVRERFGLERLIDETVAIYGVGDARIIGRPSEIA